MGANSAQLESASRAARPTANAQLFWRSLEELAGDEEFVVALRREFPEYADRLTDGATRRQFLQLMGGSLALAGLQGCVEQPQEKIVPFVQAPERVVSGKPLYYATAMTHDGAGTGLLAESHMGRPVKMEGNPLHPAVPEVMAAAQEESRLRFGAATTFAQASVLSLYDPDRSQTVLRDGQISTWDAFVAELQAELGGLSTAGGRGLRILTETVASPTLADQLRQLLEAFPNAAWHQYEPVNHDNVLLGARLAFGTDVQTIYQVDAADVILSLDADFLTDGPMHLQHARGFASRRRVERASAGGAAMNRLFVVESGMSVTGAAADHRLPLRPRAVEAFAVRLAQALGLQLEQIEDVENPNNRTREQIPQAWLDAVAADLQQARGRSLVLAGRGQPPLVHALAHWMNATLGNVPATVEYVEPIAARPEPQVESLRNLVEAMRGDEVRMLLIGGGNPVYNAPADFSFAAALEKVPMAIHLGQYEDETSARCRWHVPELHFLESWSDTRAGNGTASIVQPLVAPLRGGHTALEVVAAMTSAPVGRVSVADGGVSASAMPPTDAYEIVRDYWRRWHVEAGRGNDFEQFWATALHDGIIADTQSRPLRPTVRSDVGVAIAEHHAALPRPAAEPAVHVVFQPDAAVWDGRFANNGWLQELPRPITTLTWDNAALIAPATAERLGVKTGDVIAITVEPATVEIPVLVTPGQAANAVTLHLGYGRQRAGRIGNGVGTSVYPIRSSGAMWHVDEASIRRTKRTHKLALTQHHHLLEGRDLVRAGSLAEFQEHPDHPAFMSGGHAPTEDVSMYPQYKYDGYKWGMVINQSACVGCGACVVACQAENNVPIVGKDQVLGGREMHWLRIDHYYRGAADNPEHFHQPMLCQHCELAPCEPVCPVAATTHSSEGLNEMTYNRCIGTRYCANNCPYKVRRFNFLDYNRQLRQDAVLQLAANPDVTVRSRGVMEKCTFCVQRISAGRIAAEKEDRRIRDGEVVTACQASCPTEAIVFGDLNDNGSRVRQESASPLNYSVLGELNTRPRTTYRAVVRNPNPALAAQAFQPEGNGVSG